MWTVTAILDLKTVVSWFTEKWRQKNLEALFIVDELSTTGMGTK